MISKKCLRRFVKKKVSFDAHFSSKFRATGERESDIAREEENGSPARKSRVESIFSSSCDEISYFSRARPSVRAGKEQKDKTNLGSATISQRDAGDADGDFRVVFHLGVQGRPGDELHQSNQRQKGGE